MPTLQQILDDVKANPNTPQATQFREVIESGALDERAELEGVTLPGRPKPPVPVKTALQNIGQDIRETGAGILEAGEKGATELAESQRAFEAGEQGFISTLAQKLGTIAGTGADVVGETFIGALKVILPESAEDFFRGLPSKVIEATKEAMIVVKMREQGIDREEAIIKTEEDFASPTNPFNSLRTDFAELEEKAPEAARNVKAVFGFIDAALIAAAPGGAKVAEEAIAPTVKAGLRGVRKSVGESAGTAATTLEKSATAIEKAQVESFARELIRPSQTKKVKEAQVTRTTETGKGIFKRSEIEPTIPEAAAEKAILKIEGVSEKNTFQQNFNIVQKANLESAKELKTLLKANDFSFPKKELKARFNEAKERLKANPAIVGDAEKTADKLIAEMNRRIDAVEAKGSSLLQVRKDFDAWVKSQKGEAAFDPAKENAFSIANREIRQTVNDFIDEKAISLDVKNSLAEQRSLFTAMESITPKAAIEADTAILRALQRTGDVLGTKNKIVQGIAAGVGIGGLGAAATFAPAAAALGGLGFGTFKAGKFVMSPAVRKTMARILRELERISPKASPAKKVELQSLKGEIEDLLKVGVAAGILEASGK